METARVSDARVDAPAKFEEHAYAMQTRGYNVLPGFLDAAHCERLKSALERALEAYRPRASSERSALDRYLLHDLVCREAEVAALLDDPRLQPLVAPLLGEHWILYAFTSSSIPPGGTNYGRRIHVDSPRFVPSYASNVGVIWALDAFTAETGGTEVLPGSHNSPQTPSEDYFDRNCVQVECPQGSLIVFQARLFHRSGMNRSACFRHALTMNACRSFMKQRMDWVRFVPKSIADTLGPQGRRLLGYDTRLPTSLDEFFVPDTERLYKPNQG
jgi:ectoine hydroxylase-related dioxygenase (phytanoyl-CoA dioxygenase family)